MAKIICPTCGSKNIIFGRDFVRYQYWYQNPDGDTNWYEYEFGDNEEEVESCSINATCTDCNEIWALEGSVYDYLDG